MKSLKELVTEASWREHKLCMLKYIPTGGYANSLFLIKNINGYGPSYSENAGDTMDQEYENFFGNLITKNMSPSITKMETYTDITDNMHKLVDLCVRTATKQLKSKVNTPELKDTLTKAITYFIKDNFELVGFDLQPIFYDMVQI